MGRLNGSSIHAITARDAIAGILAIILASAAAITVVQGQPVEPWLIGTIGTVLGFYFGVGAAYDRRPPPS